MKEFIKKAIKQSNQSVLIFTNHIKENIASPKIVYANDIFLDKCGLSFEDIEGRSPVELLRKDACDSYLKKVANTIAANKTWTGVIELNPTKDQSLTFYTDIIPVCDFDNKVMYYSCFAELIEEYQKCNSNSSKCESLDTFVDALVEKADVFKGFADEMLVGMWRSTMTGEITYVNKSMTEYFGLSVGENIFTICDESPSDIPQNSAKKIIFNHNKKWIKCRFWTTKEDNILNGFCGTFQDVTPEYAIIDEIKKIKQEV